MGLTLGTLLLTAALATPAPNDEPPILIPSARAGASDLFLIDATKGDAKNLSNTAQAEELYPAWSPDGKRIAFVCKTKEHDLEVYICDADGSNRKRVTEADSPSGCFAPTWSADGKSIAYLRIAMTGKSDVRIVNADGSKDRLLAADAKAPAWSPDGASIAFVSRKAGKQLSLCTVSPDGTNLKTLVEDVGVDAPFFPAWSPDGAQIALAIATEYGWQLALAHADGGSLRQITFLPGFNINPVWLSADRILFAHMIQAGTTKGGYASVKTDGTRLALHPLTKLEPPHSVGRPAMFVPRVAKPAEHPVKPAAFVEPGTTKKPSIKVSPIAIIPPAAPGAILGAAWAADGKQFALAYEVGVLVHAELDGNTVKSREVYRGHEGAVQAAAFSPDGNFLYSAGSDKSVRVWDLSKKGSTSIETDHAAALESLALSHSGKILATSDHDGKVKIRDAATAKPEREIAVCEAKQGAVHALAFGKDDVLFAGCGNWRVPVIYGSVAAYDPATGKQLWRTKGTFGGVFSLAASPDGTKLAGACLDTFVRIWDAKTGKELACWKGHRDRATGVAWGLGGKVVVSCGFDHTVRVWDAVTGENLHVLAAHASPVVRVAASADGTRILSTGQIGAVCVWKLSETRN